MKKSITTSIKKHTKKNDTWYVVTLKMSYAFSGTEPVPKDIIRIGVTTQRLIDLWNSD